MRGRARLSTPKSWSYFAPTRCVKTTYIRVQSYVDDWGDMAATAPIGSSVVCRRRPRVDAFDSGKHFAVSSWRRNADDASPPRIKATANYLNSRLAALEAKTQRLRRRNYP